MKLHELKSTPKSRNHKAKVVGRGHGSGLGKTSGRGQKGQKHVSQDELVLVLKVVKPLYTAVYQNLVFKQ